MSNIETKQRILTILKNYPDDYFAVSKHIEGYIKSLEAIPLLMQSLPMRVFEDYCNGKLDDQQAIKNINELLRNTPD